MRKYLNFMIVAVFSLVNVCFMIGCGPEANASSEVRACWVASVGNMDFPSDMGLSADELRAEIEEIVKNCRDTGLNTIFFQVRPTGDALYRSSVFPWSRYLSGKQGKAPDKGFDPLEYFVEQAHDYGIELHAWINPYRIGSGKKVWDGLSSDNPAVIHPEYTITTDTGVYYDPGIPQVRKLVLDGISELVRNYEIDGIHFDDYFYPYEMKGFDDNATYKKYGAGLSLADFRRKSVDQLVSDAHTLIKTINNKVQFGISPFGIWANRSVHKDGSATNGLSAYSDIFADSKKWVEEGWLDYICPQVYWSNENKAAPYEVIVDWWSDLCAKHNVDLYIGLGLYKVGSDEAGWDDGSIMEEQLNYASKKEAYAGHCFFRYATMMENPLGALDSIQRYYAAHPIEKSEFTEPIEDIVIEEASVLKIASPKNGAAVNGNRISVTGTCKAGARVTVNGVEATVSDKGFYSAYVSLNEGKNIIRASSEGKTKQITVTYQPDADKAEFQYYPIGRIARNSGDVVKFRVEAEAGKALVLTNEYLQISFTEDNGVYTAEWTVPAIPSADKLLLDDFNFEWDGERIPADLTMELYGNYREEQIVQVDSYLYDASLGGSQMDHEPLPKGSFVTVIGIEGERSRLNNGYWIDSSNIAEVQVVPNEVLHTDYAVVSVTAAHTFDFSVSSNSTGIDLLLSGGRSAEYTVFSDKEINFTLDQDGNGSLLRLFDGSGGRISGYRLFPQKNKLTIYVAVQCEGLNGKTILLDAGHGGSDSGACGPGGSGYPDENALNLVLSSLLKEELEAAGAKVLLTRSGDERVTLGERVDCSLRVAPDLFISVHHNAVDQTSDYNQSSGGLVLYSAPLSESLAESVAATLWDGVGEEAAVRRQSLAVCRQYHCPSILVEAGFMSNPLEYEILCDRDIAQKIAKNIVKGIDDYFVTVYS